MIMNLIGQWRLFAPSAAFKSTLITAENEPPNASMVIQFYEDRRWSSVTCAAFHYRLD